MKNSSFAGSWQRWNREVLLHVPVFVCDDKKKVLSTVKQTPRMGKGLFNNNQDTLPGQFVGTYFGTTYPVPQSRANRNLSWHSILFSVSIVPSEAWCKAHFVNHARANPPTGWPFQTANLKAQFFQHNNRPYLGYFTSQRVAPNQELLVDYGWQYWRNREESIRLIGRNNKPATVLALLQAICADTLLYCKIINDSTRNIFYKRNKNREVMFYINICFRHLLRHFSEDKINKQVIVRSETFLKKALRDYVPTPSGYHAYTVYCVLEGLSRWLGEKDHVFDAGAFQSLLVSSTIRTEIVEPAATHQLGITLGR